MPRTVSQLVDSSPDARYVAQLNLIARDAVASYLDSLVRDGMSIREISRSTRVSIGCIRSVLDRKTADVTLGMVVALAHGLGLGTVEALIATVGSASLANSAASAYPPRMGPRE
jgi:hypothetical protein